MSIRWPPKRTRKFRRKLKKERIERKDLLEVETLLMTSLRKGRPASRAWRLVPATDEDIAKDALAGRPVKVLRVEYGHPSIPWRLSEQENSLVETLFAAWSTSKRSIASFCIGRIPEDLYIEMKKTRRAFEHYNSDDYW